ncbi:MAG: carbonic anhydrase [Desulfovibrionaceae bacterium]|nr:carbonic anhydrase [Desulfovibrionaceae bacterium]
MPHIDEILKFNEKFVAGKSYESYATTKYPDKKIAVLSCMDTRLTRLLPAALNLKNGDAKIVKSAGAIIRSPFDGAMLSLLVAVYELKVESIIVVGHHDCGMRGLKAPGLLRKMEERRISREKMDLLRYGGMDLDKWLTGFDNTEDAIRDTVRLIQDHPLMPAEIRTSGFIIDPGTGKLDLV